LAERRWQLPLAHAIQLAGLAANARE
jgi:hypothetical protein